MLFAGALVLQCPIGWLSDRLDRRKVILGTAALGALACGLGWLAGGASGWPADGALWPLMAAAFLAGGMTTPLYALLLAYTNDFLSAEDMPAASGGLVFTFGLGAILGPLLTGWAMQGARAPSASGSRSAATFA
jgi:MFS family permease